MKRTVPRILMVTAPGPDRLAYPERTPNHEGPRRRRRWKSKVVAHQWQKSDETMKNVPGSAQYGARTSLNFAEVELEG
jgi:hypothetical protein